MKPFIAVRGVTHNTRREPFMIITIFILGKYTLTELLFVESRSDVKHNRYKVQLSLCLTELLNNVKNAIIRLLDFTLGSISRNR